MRYLFFLLTLLPTLLSAQSINKNVKFFSNDLILRYNTTGKSVYPYQLSAKILINTLGIKPDAVKWGGGAEMITLKEYSFRKDTLQYEYDDSKEKYFWGFILHSSNFSIGDARNNMFFTVGDKAEVLKKWFPKFKINQNFRYVNFTLIGVKDTKTGKWLSGGSLGIGFKQNKNKEWIISIIGTDNFVDGAQLVD